MANGVTRTQLRTRALDYADQTNSSFPVTARVDDYLNQGIVEVHDLLVNANPEYYRSEATFNIAAGTESYNLPADFMRALVIYYKANSRRYTMDRFGLGQVNGYTTSPVASGTAELFYIPEATLWTNDADTVADALPSLPVGYEDIIALHAAQRLLIRGEYKERMAMVQQERERLRARLIDMVTPRDEGDNDQIEDYYGRWNSIHGRLVYPERRGFKYRIMGEKIYFLETEWLGV